MRVTGSTRSDPAMHLNSLKLFPTYFRNRPKPPTGQSRPNDCADYLTDNNAYVIRR